MSKRVPKIRFRGFTDEWEQRKLGPLMKQYSGKSQKNNQYPVLTSSRKGLFLQSEYYDGNKIASKDNTGYNVVPYGYFTYRHMSDDEVFKFNLNTLVPFGIVSTLYPVFKTTESLEAKYLQYQLNHGSEFSRYAKIQKQGGSRTYMYFSKLQQLKLTMPNSVSEQRKISGFLTLIDKIIALHQRQLELLKEQKKGFLQKMFPKAGETVPEIRFAGFVDEWKKCKVSDTAKMNPKTILPDEFQYVDLGAVVGTSLHETRHEFKDSAPSRAQRLASVGDVFYQTVRPYQKNNYFFSGSGDGPVVFSTGYMQLRPKGDSYFLLTLLQTDYFVCHVMDQSTGTSYPAINSTDLGKIHVQIPSKDEQTKIGNLFNRIDNLITTRQKQLDLLKEQKKGFLQQMFV